MKLKTESGAAVVEFALLLPLLLTMLFGIVEFSLILYDQAVITNASREAARAGIVLIKPKKTSAQIQTVATNYCQTYLISFASGTTPNVTVTQSNPANFSTPLSVTVSYTYTGLALGAILNLVGRPLTLSAISVMNNE